MRKTLQDSFKKIMLAPFFGELGGTRNRHYKPFLSLGERLSAEPFSPFTSDDGCSNKKSSDEKTTQCPTTDDSSRSKRAKSECRKKRRPRKRRKNGNAKGASKVTSKEDCLEVLKKEAAQRAAGGGQLLGSANRPQRMDDCPRIELAGEDQGDEIPSLALFKRIREGDLDPDVSKSGVYKNPEYYSYHKWTFYDATKGAVNKSCPQPSNKRYYKPSSEDKENN